MDMPDFSSGRSPRRELQGPRPAPLKVRKDSHKIRKPPVAPPPAASHPHRPPQAPPLPPVIIYTVSPKIIHANPNEFMSLVQRLTGPSATSPSSAPAFTFHEGGGAVSPAARFASIERTRSPDGRKAAAATDTGTEMVDGIEIDTIYQRSGQFPGILSPNPNALPPIPANFFNISSDNNNPLNFFHDLSPVLHSSRIYSENNFIFPSPSPHMNTPSPNTLDLFHSLFDL